MSLAAAALSLSVSSALAASPISASLLGVQDVAVGFSGATFTLKAGLLREGGLPIVVKDVHYQLIVGGQVIGEGRQEEHLRLKRGERAVLRIPSTLSPRGGIAALASMASDPDLELRLVGEASGRWLFFSRTEQIEEVVTTRELLSAFLPR